MHIPDNYLSPSTCGILFLAMIPVWKIAAKKVKEEISIKKMPLLGVCAAFSFLIMMFNVPLPGGTTGHAVGAVLAAILLGPWSAVIAITIALAIQALFFGDGGILALGANCFNMAFIMPFAGHYIYKFIINKINLKNKEFIAAFIAGYIGLTLAAFFTAFQFGIQPYLFTDAAGIPLYTPYGLDIALPAIMIPHLLVASVLEGLVSAAVFVYIKNVAPESVYSSEEKVSFKPLAALIGAMVLLSPLGLMASGTAWGEWGKEELAQMAGFMPKGMLNGINFEAIMPDYAIHGIHEVQAYIASAVAGIFLIAIFMLLFTRKRLVRT